MEKRTYNILFDTHTVAGIIISVALYVIFFAGTISFLRNEIIAWEQNAPVKERHFENADFDANILKLQEKDTLYSRDLTFYANKERRVINANMSPRKDVKEKARGERRRGFFTLDLATGEKSDYVSSYTLGEFFYRLHFFAQLNFYGRSGYFFAGFISFFFLFALVTGLIIHWDKIVSSFYLFRPKAAWKTVWTDAHVGLGLIGFPYQFMFAVTGAYFIFGYAVMIEPVGKWIYGEDNKKLGQALEYEEKVALDFANIPLEKTVHINDLVKKAQEELGDVNFNKMTIGNFGDQNMYVDISASQNFESKFTGSSRVVLKAADGSVLYKKSDDTTPYIEGAQNIMLRLHFGDYGGYGVRIMYIILGFLSCFVIISGVLIWFVARDKKNVSPTKRKMNRWVVNVYLSVCLSMLPITAFTFIAVKLFGSEVANRRDFIYEVFFYGWLILSLFFIYKRDNFFTNKANLLLGGVLSLVVPITDGIVTGNWLWTSFQRDEIQIFAVNFFWLMVGIISLWVFLKTKKRVVEK